MILKKTATKSSPDQSLITYANVVPFKNIKFLNTAAYGSCLAKKNSGEVAG